MGNEPQFDSAGEGVYQDAALCPNCLTPNHSSARFCERCGTPMTSLAEIDPLASIHARGDTFRKAAARPTRPIILIGMWLILAPQIPVIVWAMWYEVLAPVPLLETFGAIFLGAGGITLYTAMLWKTTRNYFRARQSTADEA